MVASVQNRRRQFSPTIRANVRIAEFDFKTRIILFKSLNSSESEVGFDF